MQSAPGKKPLFQSRRAISEMSGFLARPWVIAAAFAAILVLSAVTPVASALFLKESLDSITTRNPSRFFYSGLLMILAYGVDASAVTLGTSLRLNVLEEIAVALRGRLVRKAMAMPFSRYEKLSKGDLVSRVTADVNEASRIFTALYYIFEVAVRALAAIGLLIYLRWDLGLMVLGVLILSTLLNGRLTEPIGGATKEYQSSLGKIAAYALNAIEGHTVIKSFQAEERIDGAFSQRAATTRDKAMAISKRVSVAILAAIAGGFGTLLVAFGYGAYLAVAGKLTLGVMLASFNLTDYITPLGFMGGRLAELQQSSGAYERVREIMEAEEDADLPAPELGSAPVLAPVPGPAPALMPAPVAESTLGRSASSNGGAADSFAPATEPDIVISVRGLSYEYVPGVKALDEVSFDIRRGQRVAVVGRSGCGKSTLMKILAGLYRAEPDSVFIDGHDMAFWRLARCRSKVTYVPQEPFLFAGSIWDNLALGYGGPSALAPRRVDGVPGVGALLSDSDSQDVDGSTELDGALSGVPSEAVAPQVRRALELGDALEIVLASDEGLRSEVGERGSLLSGGQRQRLCLARGFLRDTPILLLDEPTSSVDREAEARILAGLAALPELTCVMVTHRFDVAEAAELVLVMDSGRVVEMGTHDELLRNPGLYWSLFTGEVALTSPLSPQMGGPAK